MQLAVSESSILKMPHCNGVIYISWSYVSSIQVQYIIIDVVGESEDISVNAH